MRERFMQGQNVNSVLRDKGDRCTSIQKIKTFRNGLHLLYYSK